MKNLHLPHLLHPSKLSGKQSSFGSGCAFVKFFLHPTCTFCTRLPFDCDQGELRDEALRTSGMLYCERGSGHVE